MPKNLRSNTQEKTKKRKNTNEGDIIERSRLPNPNEPPIHMESKFDVHLNVPVKIEDIGYPDTRFPCSTTLFPAKGVEDEYLQPKDSSKASKRCSEEELISSVPKTTRASDLSETINPLTPDDCVIVENLQKQVKIEIIDLTDDSNPVVPELCYPVKVAYQKTAPGKPNTILPANGAVPIKVENDEKTYKIINAVDAAGMNYAVIQKKFKQNRTNDSNSETSNHNSNFGLNKNTNFAQDIQSDFQLKIENSFPSANINKVNKDNLIIKPHLGSHFQIKAEKNNSRGRNTEANSQKYEVIANEDSNSKTCSIILSSGPNEGNEDNREINSHVPVSTIASVCDAKISADSGTLVNKLDVPIKIEQNENCIINNNSISLANLFSDVKRTRIRSVDRPIKKEKIKSNENCKVCSSSNSASNSCTEVETEHRSMFVNEPQTHEKVDDEISKLPANNKEVQENVVCDKSKKNIDSSFNYLSVVQPRNKQEKEPQKTSYRCENPQSYDGISQENTEMIIGDELNLLSIYPIADSIVFSSNSQLYDPETFQMPLLGYLNCNMKVDVLEVSHILSILNAIKDKEEITLDNNVNTPDPISPSTNTQDKFELNLIDKRKELLNQEGNEKSIEENEFFNKVSSYLKLKKLWNSTRTTTSSVSKSVSPRLEKSIKENNIQNLLNNDGLGEEMEKNNSFNKLFEWISKNELNWANELDSHANFNSSVNIRNILEESYQSINSLLSLSDNKRSETSNNMPMEEKKKLYKNSLANDCLRQTLSNANSRETSDSSDISHLQKTSDQEVNSNLIINEGAFQNLRQIKLTDSEIVGRMISSSNAIEKNSKYTFKNSENVPKLLRVSNKNVFKQGDLYNKFTTSDDNVETPSKRVKMSEDTSTSKSGNAKNLSYGNYKKGTRKDASPHNLSDYFLGKHLAADFRSNSPNFLGSNFEENMIAPPRNSQIHNLPVSSNTSSHNPSNYVRNTELAPNCSPTLYKDVNWQNKLNSFNINQAYPFQNAPDTIKSFIHPQINQTPSVSYTNETEYSACVPPSIESFLPPIIAMKIQQVNQMLSEINSLCPSNFIQRNSEKNSIVLPSVLESSSSFMTQNNPQQSVQDVKGLPSLSYLRSNALSPSSQHPQLQEISLLTSEHSALTDDCDPSETVHRESLDNPPLPADSPPPPLPPLPPISYNEELFNSIATNGSQMVNTNKKLSSVKSSSPEFKSLLPTHLTQDIGKNIIHTNDVYLIIIERNINWILGIDKEIEGELLEVQGSYANHLVYYNTYFPLLLLECFSKISTILKGLKKEKIDKKIYKIVHCETKQNYVSFICEGFIRQSEVENVPKDGHIILVKFGTFPTGGMKMLGFVCSSATRAYSHRHDHTHGILNYMNVKKRTELIKIKINFYIVFSISGINLDLPIEITKLTSIKRILMLNDALKELQRSPLCNTVLNPRNNNCKNFTLPCRQNTNTMSTVVQDIVQSLSSSSPQLIAIESAPSTDSFLAIVQIIEEIQKTKIPGKILVCVRLEMLNHMGMNLIRTSRKVIIINRERENVNRQLQNNVLDVLASQLSNSQNISEDVAKSKVLQEADVLLVVTGTCFYEDVQRMIRNLIFCIVHDAHKFTETESLLPLLYGIRHLLLFGYHKELCNASSKRASSFGYNKSLFHRAYK